MPQREKENEPTGGMKRGRPSSPTKVAYPILERIGMRNVGRVPKNGLLKDGNQQTMKLAADKKTNGTVEVLGEKKLNVGAKRSPLPLTKGRKQIRSSPTAQDISNGKLSSVVGIKTRRQSEGTSPLMQKQKSGVQTVVEKITKRSKGAMQKNEKSDVRKEHESIQPRRKRQLNGSSSDCAPTMNGDLNLGQHSHNADLSRPENRKSMRNRKTKRFFDSPIKSESPQVKGPSTPPSKGERKRSRKSASPLSSSDTTDVEPIHTPASRKSGKMNEEITVEDASTRGGRAGKSFRGREKKHKRNGLIESVEATLVGLESSSSGPNKLLEPESSKKLPSTQTNQKLFKDTDRLGKLRCKTCNKYAQSACAQESCFACCLKIGAPCLSHEAQRKQHEEFQELMKPQEKKPKMVLAKGSFNEEAFQDFEETVTIWCLRDFLQDPKLCRDLLESQVRSLRAQQRLGGSKLVPVPTKRRRRNRAKKFWEEVYPRLMQKIEDKPQLEAETSKNVLG